MNIDTKKTSWQPPKRFGDYEILEKIDDGGMGAIYKAQDIETQEVIAIKIMVHESQYRRFEREAEASSRLSHPNFVRFHKKGEICGKMYIVMDYIDGKPLKNFMEKEDVPFQEKIYIFYKILNAIAFAHDNGIIHRDLKPANIIVNKSNEPVILDFGLSKCVDLEETKKDDTYLTLEGQILGTPGYMSPEQARGEANLQDVRTDVFSLGIILYEMLSGHNPFEGDNIIEICYKIGNQPPVPIEHYIDLDPQLVQIINTSLQNNIMKRYQTSQEFLDDFEMFLRNKMTEMEEQETEQVVDVDLDESVICLICGTGNSENALYCRDCNNILKKEFHRDTKKIHLKGKTERFSNARKAIVPPLPQHKQNLQKVISDQILSKSNEGSEAKYEKIVTPLPTPTIASFPKRKPKLSILDILFGAFGFSFSLIPIFYKYKFPLEIHILDFVIGGLATYFLFKLQKYFVSILFFPLAFLLSCHMKHFFEIIQEPFHITYLPETIIGTILTMLFARCLLLIFRDISGSPE